MIKFFRTIRKRSLTQHKFSRYVIYAIGEIVLIVIGIMVALWLNTRKDEMGDREMEQVLLSELKSEFAHNLDLIHDGTEYWRGAEKVLKTVLENTGKPADSLTHLNVDSLILVTSLHHFFNPSNHTLQEALNSGKLNLIEDGELRANLFQWSSVLGVLHKSLDARMEIQTNQFAPFLIREISYKTTDYNSGIRSDSSLIGGGLTSTEVMNNVVFENYVVMDHYNVLYIIARFERIESLTSDILEKIDKNLDDPGKD